jgi:tetratricopeptide (TPR) repeat protein
MFRKWSPLLLLVITFFAAGSAVFAADTAAQLLERGIYTEETVGDLQAAIDLYQKAVLEALNDEARAAEAQYRVGQCLLKQKKNDKAVAVFQLVIDSYPDQKEWVAKAKQHVPVLLKYDDDSMESKRSTTGGGHAVLFKCPAEGDWYLDQVQLFGARYGLEKAPNENFSIYITDPKMEKVCKISKPYSTFVRGNEKWTTIKITPVKVPGEFYVCFVFNPTQTKGVYVGMDENVAESHSKEAVPGDHISEMPKKADWMIRAHITPFASGKPLQLAGKKEQDKSQESAVADSDVRLLKGAKSTVLKYDNGKMDKHQSFGGEVAQTIMFEAPAAEQFVYGVTFYGSQYGGQHDFDAVNGDIYILDGDMNVISRTSFPYSLLTQQKAWIEVPTLPTKVTGKFYIALHAHSEQNKGIYVGYNENVESSHSSVSDVSPKRFEKMPSENKLEWMIRAKLADKPVYYEATK